MGSSEYSKNNLKEKVDDATVCVSIKQEGMNLIEKREIKEILRRQVFERCWRKSSGKLFYKFLSCVL
jgi:hypothetical protein